MKNETHAKANDKPVMLSNSRVIQAADAALAAINEHFKAEVENGEWYDLALLQRAALRAALASIIFGECISAGQIEDGTITKINL